MQKVVTLRLQVPVDDLAKLKKVLKHTPAKITDEREHNVYQTTAELAREVIALRKQGFSTRSVEKLTGVSRTTVSNITRDPDSYTRRKQ